MDPQGTLSESDARAHLDTLLEGVPASQAPEVMSHALWCMPPWSSYTPYIRLMFRVAGDRYGEGLNPSGRALALAAHGRSSLADRRYGHGISECEAALELAAAHGGPALKRACGTLALRAKLLAGRTAEALDGITYEKNVYCPDDPDVLGLETLLTVGIARLVQGEASSAMEALGAVEAATVTAELRDIAGWQRTMALAGLGHTLFRAFRPHEALKPLGEALSLARANQAPRETADLLVMRSVCGLASSSDSPLEGLEETATLVAGLPDANGAVDLFTGLPADLGGSGSLKEAAGALYESARERAVSMDAPGFLAAVLGIAGLLAVDDGREEALKMIRAAKETLSSAPSPEPLSMLQAAEVVLDH